MTIDDADEYLGRQGPSELPRERFDDDRFGGPDVIRIDPERDLPGSIYAVPDSYWGFEVPDRSCHPGACAYCRVSTRSATLVKGTDAHSLGAQHAPVLLVEPSPSNGLTKPTAFRLAPRYFRLNKAVLLHYNRRMGGLDPEDLDRLRDALRRLFDPARGRA